MNDKRATLIPKEDTLAEDDFLRMNLDCEVPSERVETPKVRVHARGYRKFKKRRKQRHSRGGLQYCRSMFQGRGLTKRGATSLRGRSARKLERVRLVCSWKIKVALPKG